MTTITVAVIAANDLIRAGVDTIIRQSNRDIQVVSACPSIAVFEQETGQYKQHPKVLLLDDSASRLKPIPIVRHFKQCYPAMKIVVMSDFLNELYIQRLMDCGAKGFLYLQDHLEDILVACIRIVAEEEPFLSPGASTLPFSRIVTDQFNQTDIAVLELTDAGFTPSEIADRLDIVPRTVYRSRRKWREYLNVKTSEQIVEAARKHGFLRESAKS